MTTQQILIIDDEEEIREVVRACLEDLGGWKVLAAASGNEGLLKAQSENVDAILLDVSMPEMDGFHCFKLLQDHPLTQTIPVILLTAKVLPHDQARFAAMGIAGVITKPFNPAVICDQVAKILNWSW